MHPKTGRLAFKVALIYVFVAGGWVVFSGELVKWLVHNPEQHIQIFLFTGLALVIVTGGMLHLGLRLIVRHWQQEAEQRKQAEAAHQETEEKLRQNEEKMQLVLEASAEGVWDWNLKTGVADLSSRYWEIIGYPPGETMANMDFPKGLVHPEDWPKVDQALQEHYADMAAQFVCEFEFRSIGKNDTTRWTLMRGKVVTRAPDGTPLRMVGTNSDITQRKLAEQQLREFEECYHQLFELESDAVVLVDCKTHRFMDVNLAAQRLYGYSREEFLQLVPEDISDEPEKTRETVGRGYYCIPLRWHHKKNGERFAVEITANQINYYGRPTELATIRDISFGQQTMEKLQETAQQLLAAQRLARIGSYSYDVATGLWNSSVVLDELFGIADLRFKKDLADWLQIIHPEDRGEMEHYLKVDVLKGRGEFDREYRIIRQSDQRIRWVHGLGRLILDDRGEVAQMVGIIQDITERKLASEALREGEERYNALFNSSLDCVFLHDFEGRFFDANHAALNLFGYRREEISSLSLKSLIAEDQLPLAFQLIEEILATGQQHQPTEFRLRAKDGREVLMETLSSLIYRDGKPFAIQGIARDITERKRIEAKLNYEQNLWQTMLDTSPDHIYFKDTASRFIKCSKAVAVQFGVTSLDEVMGKTDFDFFTEARARLSFEDEQEIIRTGRPILNKEEREVLRDGRVTWASSTKMPMRDGTGKIIGIMGISRDITERKLVDESHARLATAVEQAAESIVITDIGGTILYVNPAFEKNSGYTRAEILGKNPRVLKSGKHNAEFYHRMWAVLGRGEIWSGHFISRRKDGALYEEEATITPVRDADGQVVNYVAVKRDVTREVQLEAQFRQSQKMEAIGQLAGGVAHDFNNILAVIQLQTSQLKAETGLSSQQLEYASDIESAAQRAANLTRQLLMFGRKQSMQPSDVDLNEAITGIAKMLQRILGEQIHVQFKFATQPLLIHADTSMLDQVLMNLAVNARDAMPKGGQLIIETSAEEFDEAKAAQMVQAQPGSFVRVTVADTGSGIPPEILPRIFEPFFTTKDVGKGSGLGLAMVFGIIQQHRGWISVYSEIGRGTTFRIYLPRLNKVAGNKVVRPSLAAIAGRNETILVVEDEPVLRANVRSVLTRLGYRVLEASHGRAAVEVWKQHRAEIQLVLTDMVMPGGMTGIDLAAELLRQDPKLKVVFASGYSADIASNDFPMVEGLNFLSKPFEVQKLAQIIRQRLDRK
jgi:PAS domain S-box-containing protein